MTALKHFCLPVLDGGSDAGFSAAVVPPTGCRCLLQGSEDFIPPMRISRLPQLRHEVSGLLLFCERGDNLDVP